MLKIVNAGGVSPRDPMVCKHKGMYYRCFTKDTNAVWVSCAKDIAGLLTAPEQEVYRPEPGREYSCNLWAPELHIIDGKCYIYVACDDGDKNNHRMYVLENGCDDPLQPYTLHGKLAPETDKYAIDGTVLHHKGQMYFVWSGREGDVSGCQKLYIAKMDGPCALATDRVLISTPEYAWEKRGGLGIPGKSWINEGPFAFTWEGRTWLAYSAAGSWCEDYCIAAMELVGEDPLDPAAWKKLDEPVFSRNETVKGAGHCSMVRDGGKTHVFFHAWEREETQIVWCTVAAWCGELTRKNGRFTIE